MSQQVLIILSCVMAVHCLHDLNINGDHSMLSTSELKDGSCPYQPGELQSIVKDSFDYSKLQGVWKDIYDVKNLQNDFACPSFQFKASDFIDESAAKVLNVEMAYGYSEKYRQQLRNRNHNAAHEPYLLDIYKRLSFRHPQDKTIGYIESSLLTPEDWVVKEGDLDTLDAVTLFEQHYLRYSQVLDTDYDNYIILYSCQEGADYIKQISGNKNGQKITKIDDLFDHNHVVRLENPDPKLYPSRTAYKFKSSVKKNQFHHQKIQILQRIKISNQPNVYILNLQKLLKTVSDIIPNFTQKHLDKNYAMMSHIGNSKSEPLEKLKSYVASHELLHMLHEGGNCPYELFFISDPNHILFSEASETIYEEEINKLDPEIFQIGEDDTDDMNEDELQMMDDKFGGVLDKAKEKFDKELDDIYNNYDVKDDL